MPNVSSITVVALRYFDGWSRPARASSFFFQVRFISESLTFLVVSVVMGLIVVQDPTIFIGEDYSSLNIHLFIHLISQVCDCTAVSRLYILLSVDENQLGLDVIY